MLETEIKKLTDAIKELNDTMSALRGYPTAVEQAAADAEEAAKPKEVEIPFPPTGTPVEPEAETPQPELVPAITHDDLQELCMVLVRNDRGLKDTIKGVIGEFGATVIRKVAESDLPALKAKLEALK